MKRKTTALQMQNTIKSNQLILQSAEVYNKSTRKTEEIPNNKFLGDFGYFCESGVFADFVDWHYERNLSVKDEYILDSGAMNPYSENVVIAYLRVNDSAKIEDVERILKIEEE